MTKRRALLITAVVGTAWPHMLWAQASTDVTAGVRVLVVARGAPRSSPLWLLAGRRGVEGSVARLTPDTLFLTDTKPSRPSGIALSRTAIREVYVHTGRSSRPGQVVRAVAGGALIFGAQEALVGQVTEGRVNGTRVSTMTGIGAVLGAVLGATSPLDRWRRVSF